MGGAVPDAQRSLPRSMIRLEPLDDQTLGAFAALLGGQEFGGCFCAVWTSHGPGWSARCVDPARPNLAVTRERVLAGQHVGYLVRDGSEVVAWTGAGPKSGFPALGTRLAARLTPMSDDVWAIGCLAISRARRGAGLSASIVNQVIGLARAAGARAVEAYPTRPWDEPRSYRGSLTTYERLGFRESGAERDGDSEIVLLRLGLGHTA